MRAIRASEEYYRGASIIAKTILGVPYKEM